MFPYLIMDRFLKLKLELAYKDLAVDQARQVFNELQQPVESVEAELVIPKPAPKKRKRIPAKK